MSCEVFNFLFVLRHRISDGTGEWRQLLLDMQEIVDWLVRADQELTSQKPIGGDIETIQQQNENHQVRNISTSYTPLQLSGLVMEICQKIPTVHMNFSSPDSDVAPKI